MFLCLNVPLIEGAWCKLMQNELGSTPRQVQMPTQNYVRAAAAPESRAPRAWQAASRAGLRLIGGVAESAGSVWQLHHSQRYLHVLRRRRLTLAAGCIPGQRADSPASTQSRFGKLAAPWTEVVCVCNPPRAWTCLVPGQFPQESVVHVRNGS